MKKKKEKKNKKRGRRKISQKDKLIQNLGKLLQDRAPEIRSPLPGHRNEYARKGGVLFWWGHPKN